MPCLFTYKLKALCTQRPHSAVTHPDRQGPQPRGAAQRAKKNPECLKEHANQTQLGLVTNATGALAAEVIRKLAVITRQAERIRPVQPEDRARHASPVAASPELG